MLRILVVDDQDNVRASVSMMLRLQGSELVGAATAQIGMRELDTSNFDLAIVDIFLQGTMDGIEVIRAFRGRAPTLPIIAISGVTVLDFPSDDPELSNVIFLPKPIRPNELINAVDAAIQSRPI
jgi:DNA-binding NtrC family response regulator